ncbi:MAG TPA: 2-phospho-L-lactate guanylyltransferase [Acidimicrobiales bacterium]|nr:2-phospho-L-lactate guanylyltransferase [Acidimicrobiales bacterium]
MQVILVPVKSFREAKHRLASVLSNESRVSLAKALAEIVINARGASPVFVACDDSEVADWAIERGATVLWTPGLGLSGAVGAGFRHLVSVGFSRVIIAHADLPFVTDLEHFGSDDLVTIAPDHHLDGTNVIAIPSSTPFTFFYGPRSYQRHKQEAADRHMQCRSVFDWRLASDIDLPSDLVLVGDLMEPRTSRKRAVS